MERKALAQSDDRAVVRVSVFGADEKVAEVKKKKKREKRENETLRFSTLLNTNQNFHLPEGQQKRQPKTKQPSNIHLKVRTIIRN